MAVAGAKVPLGSKTEFEQFPWATAVAFRQKWLAVCSWAEQRENWQKMCSEASSIGGGRSISKRMEDGAQRPGQTQIRGSQYINVWEMLPTFASVPSHQLVQSGWIVGHLYGCNSCTGRWTPKNLLFYPSETRLGSIDYNGPLAREVSATIMKISSTELYCKQA